MGRSSAGRGVSKAVVWSRCPRESTVERQCGRAKERVVEKRTWKRDEGSTGTSQEVRAEKANKRRQVLEGDVSS